MCTQRASAASQLSKLAVPSVCTTSVTGTLPDRGRLSSLGTVTAGIDFRLGGLSSWAEADAKQHPARQNASHETHALTAGSLLQERRAGNTESRKSWVFVRLGPV